LYYDRLNKPKTEGTTPFIRISLDNLELQHGRREILMGSSSYYYSSVLCIGDPMRKDITKHFKYFSVFSTGVKSKMSDLEINTLL
jgi:hypothetical protein